eukprot:Awhi_evm1s3077
MYSSSSLRLRHKWTCDHCGKPYHVRKSCWELHPELKPKPKTEKVNVQKKKKKSKPKAVPIERKYKSLLLTPNRTRLDTAASVHVLNNSNNFANICNETTVIECVGRKNPHYRQRGHTT